MHAVQTKLPQIFSLPALTPTLMILKELMGKLEITVSKHELCFRKADIIKHGTIKIWIYLAHVNSMFGVFFQTLVLEMKETGPQPSDRFLSLLRIMFSRWFHGTAFHTSDCAATTISKTSLTGISCSSD